MASAPAASCKARTRIVLCCKVTVREEHAVFMRRRTQRVVAAWAPEVASAEAALLLHARGAVSTIRWHAVLASQIELGTTPG